MYINVFDNVSVYVHVSTNASTTRIVQWKTTFGEQSLGHYPFVECIQTVGVSGLCVAVYGWLVRGVPLYVNSLHISERMRLLSDCVLVWR